mmetsp:Transcript_21019/g.67114  ORF Transcript_21019/g.67114 Transcript_21019/m.67114 type:complete len:361 (-) Transcript_21019:301-1383(-)
MRLALCQSRCEGESAQHRVCAAAHSSRVPTLSAPGADRGKRFRGSCDGARRRRRRGVELVDCGGAVHLAAPQHRRGEVRVVWAVGEVLRLEAEARELVVLRTASPLERAVQIAGRVELHAGLVRRHGHAAAARRLVDAAARAEPVLARRRGEHVVVVVPHPAVRLREPLPDRRRRGEVHRTADGPHLAGRDRGLVDRRVEPRGELDLVLLDRPRPAVLQVPVRVVGQVDHRRLVAHRLVLHPQLALCWKGVGDLGEQVAGVPLLTVLREERERHRRVARRLAHPVPLVETDPPAVEGIRAVVGREGVALPVQLEAASLYPVGVPARDAAKIRAPPVHIRRQLVEAERHLADNAILVGHTH